MRCRPRSRRTSPPRRCSRAQTASTIIAVSRPSCRRLLAPGGAVLLEIGWTQAQAVGDLLRDQGFAVTEHRDLGDATPRLAGDLTT